MYKTEDCQHGAQRSNEIKVSVMTEALAAFLGKWIFLPIIGPIILHLYVHVHKKVSNSVSKEEFDRKLTENQSAQDVKIEHLKETYRLELRNLLTQLAQNQERQENSNQMLQRQLEETNRKLESMMTKLEPMAEDLAVVKSKTNQINH